MPRVRPKIKTELLTPYWSTTDGNTVRLYHGDVIGVLRQLPPRSIHCAITSPPYWGLRDYGPSAKFKTEAEAKNWSARESARLNRDFNFGGNVRYIDRGVRFNERENTWTGRVAVENRWEDGSWCAFGSEETPELYVAHSVLVFREVRRVLRDDGTFWLNLGDSYNANTGLGFNGNAKRPEEARETRISSDIGLAQGNLVGVPWRVALALQADGWVLRQEIIWHKPSPMPESVRNRCTKAHEHVFLLTKSADYYYDAEAIKEKSKDEGGIPGGHKYADAGDNGSKHVAATRATLNEKPVAANSNKRSVWTVASAGYAGAHFATFPLKLIEPMILAGTSEKGACAECGTPYERIVEEVKMTRERPNDYVKRKGEEGTGNSCANSVAGVETKTLGWKQVCYCDTDEVVPCAVLDPFIGSGTTCEVAINNGRNSVGIDLSETYLRENAIPRIEGILLGSPGTARLVPRKK